MLWPALLGRGDASPSRAQAARQGRRAPPGAPPPRPHWRARLLTLTCALPRAGSFLYQRRVHGWVLCRQGTACHCCCCPAAAAAACRRHTMCRQHSGQHLRLPGRPVDAGIQLLHSSKSAVAQQASRAKQVAAGLSTISAATTNTCAWLPPAMLRPPAAPPNSIRQPWAPCPPSHAAGSCTPPPQKRQDSGRTHSVAGQSGGRTCRVGKDGASGA